MTAPRDYFLTAQEVADEQRLSVETMYTWRARSLKGDPVGPKSSKRGRRVVYRRSDVDAWVAAMESETAAGAA